MKISGSILLLLGAVLLLALKRVDYTPYLDSDYYSGTRMRLDSISEKLELAEGDVQVGLGRVSITPSLGAEQDDAGTGSFRELPLAGYGKRKGKYARGIHDSLYVKAAAIRVGEQLMVLVASDMLIVPPNIAEGVARMVHEKMGIGRDQLFFSATHTHSGVGAWSDGFVGEEFAGAPNPRLVEWLIRQFSLAVDHAVADLQEGKLGSGSFRAPEMISNRLVGDRGVKDSEFIYLAAMQDSGKKAVLGSFGAHATTLGGDNMQFSGDYPGYWQRKLERNGFDMALFFAGSMGSHSPASQGEDFERARYLGEALADSVIRYMAHTELRESTGLSFLSLEMDLPEFHIRVSDGLRLNPGLGRRLFPPIGKVYLQAARIGDLIWVTTPGDFSGEMAVGFRSTLKNRGYRTLVSSFNGAYVGYIIPGKYYHMNEYESRLMSWFGPYMGPYTEDMIRRMTRALVSLDQHGPR